jgi:4-hydroxybenzoate polyprenyltransferase
MGYSAASGNLGIAPFALYAAGICWTMVYDTIYAHQDKVDDQRVGVRSTALRFGDKTVQICTNFTTAMGLALFMAGLSGGLGPTFYMASFLSTCMILRGLSLVDLNNPKSCWEFFLMNRNIGIIILISIILGKVF